MNSFRIVLVLASCGVFLFDQVAGAQTNYDEAKVPDYKLPDPLVAESGERIATADQWVNLRRPEVLRLFGTHVYGFSPPPAKGQSFKVTSVEEEALEGKAIRKEVTVRFAKEEGSPEMNILIYSPADADAPVPVFLGAQLPR